MPIAAIFMPADARTRRRFALRSNVLFVCLMCGLAAVRAGRHFLVLPEAQMNARLHPSPIWN
jgi:hypothetical protein